MILTNCKECGGDLGPDAIVCSHCGAQVERWGTLFIIILILFLAFIFCLWWGLWGLIVPAFLSLGFFGSRNDKQDKQTDYKTRATPAKSSWVKVKCSLHITYEDEEGNVTERDIKIFSYKPTTQHLQARDSLRNANRTFRIDRIQEAIDSESGEMLNTNNLHPWIMEHKA